MVRLRPGSARAARASAFEQSRAARAAEGCTGFEHAARGQEASAELRSSVVGSRDGACGRPRQVIERMEG
jgi:hypothetical protein